MADKTKKTSSGSNAKKSGARAGFTNFIKNAGKFLRDCRGEVKKIVWPTREATFKNTGIVMVVIAIIGLFVFGLDVAFLEILSRIMKVAG
jgi:preprotein translocase, SecE subunit, bacterial